MNDIEQRIAIAEACGWSNKSSDDRLKDGSYRWDIRRDGTIFGLKPLSWEDGKPIAYLSDQRVPDYLNDFNALHEAIIHISQNNEDWCWGAFGCHMNMVCGIGLWELTWAVAATATPAQWAEAVIRTLNITDDPRP